MTRSVNCHCTKSPRHDQSKSLHEIFYEPWMATDGGMLVIESAVVSILFAFV